MGYDYATERPAIFTEAGQVMFLEIRDRAKRLTAEAGAATMERIISGTCGSSWQMLACVDRLVELRELREIDQGRHVAGQHRIFAPPLR